MKGKKFLTFGIPILALALVSAVLVTHLISVEQDIQVDQAISVNGQPVDTSITESLITTSNGWEQKFTSQSYKISNIAERDLNVDVLSVPSDLDLSVSHDTIGLSTTWSSDASAFADASISGSTVSLEANVHAVDWSDASESRITLDGADIKIYTLNDLANMSWDVSTGLGYAPHVDVYLDLNDNGVYDSGTDDVLVFEYAKVDNTNCDNSGSYPTGSFDTFNDKGIIDGSAFAWLNSGSPGACGSPTYYAHSLDDWKVGQTENGKTIDGNTKVLRLELEIDAWVSDSSADISNIVVNGVQKEIATLGGTFTVDSNSNRTFYVNKLIPTSLSAGTYSIDTTVDYA